MDVIQQLKAMGEEFLSWMRILEENLIDVEEMIKDDRFKEEK